MLSASQGTVRSTGQYSLVLLVAGLLLSNLAAAVLSNGNLLVAVAPTVLFLFGYALVKLPLRVPAAILFCCAFVLEIPSDSIAVGQWNSPVAILGALLFNQLKHTIPVRALVITGLDLVLLLLFAIHAYRRATGSTIDQRGAIRAPAPFFWAVWASLFGCFMAFVWGMATGGIFRFSLWQIQRIIYIPLVFLLLQAAFPRPAQYEILGKLLVACACFRALLAIYLRSLFPDAIYATTHPDSMLFALASCIVVFRFLEERNRRSLLALLLVLPILVWGMIANDRRLVWVELGFSLVLAFALVKRTKLKTKLSRAVLVALPILVGYTAAGWSSGKGIFAPIATVRSIVDSDSDSSTKWRDLENYNLVITLKNNPIIGTGLGHPYELAVHMPDITHAYELEPYAPHNSILGLWAYQGYVGFALHWMTLVVTVFFSIRTYRFAHEPRDRTAALTCFAAVVIYMIHLYGDLALGTWASVFMISAAMVISGKLAVQVGAWPGRGATSASPRAPEIEVVKQDEAPGGPPSSRDPYPPRLRS